MSALSLSKALNIPQALWKGFTCKSAPSWRKALLKPAEEFPLSKLSVISGSVPKNLNGTLYRNGPGRIARGDQLAKHWVDGDGAILGVFFQNGQVSAKYQYIQTKGYQEEEKANKFIYAGLGATMNVPFWKRPLIQEFKNSGNTSILPLSGKLLALWEGGLPHSLDLETLQTMGVDQLGFLSKDETFSAHPKMDPVSNEIYNFGFIRGPKMEMGLYKFDNQGRILQRNNIPMRFNIVHDCVIAGKYLVIMNFPTKIASLSSAIFGLKPLKDLIKWAPELGTEVIIIDRNDMSLVNRFMIDPMYSCHFTNGCEEKDGTIHLELVTYDSYDDFNDYVIGVPDFTKPLPPGLTARLSSMKLDPVQGKMVEMKYLSEPGVEFPSSAESKTGQKWRYSLFAKGSGLNRHAADDQFGAIARYDSYTQNTQVYEYGENMYATEPALASFDEDPENGHILTLIYDAANEKSEIWVHDSMRLEGDPVCRLALPGVVPLGFHGKWLPKN